MTEHTKLPWRNQCFQILGADNSRIAHTGMGNLPPSRSSESEANAAFIVKAVNSHEALLAELILARARIEYLGAACAERHFTHNAEVVLPRIDRVLAAVGQTRGRS